VRRRGKWIAILALKAFDGAKQRPQDSRSQRGFGFSA
jgi:hypothetical protein